MFEEQKKIKIAKSIALIIGILVICGLGGYLFLFLKSDKNTPASIPSLNSSKNEQSENRTTESQSTKNSSQESCAQTFNNDEKEMLKSFSIYTNKAFNLTFKYPNNWKKIFGEDKYILFEDVKGESASLTFRITIADRAAVNTEEFNKVSSKNVTVACVPTTETYYHGYGLSEGAGKVIVDMKKNGIPFVIEMSYPDNMGASISSDYHELFDLILKTIEIK